MLKPKKLPRLKKPDAEEEKTNEAETEVEAEKEVKMTEAEKKSIVLLRQSKRLLLNHLIRLTTLQSSLLHTLLKTQRNLKS